MRRQLLNRYELDDNRERIDVEAVHSFLTVSYWAKGRTLEEVRRSIDGSARVLGLYLDHTQIGFARAISDGVARAYLADVYVLEDFRGEGLGIALIDEMVNGKPLNNCLWLLHTLDAHDLYRRVGFTEPSERVMERA